MSGELKAWWVQWMPCKHGVPIQPGVVGRTLPPCPYCRIEAAKECKQHHGIANSGPYFEVADVLAALEQEQ